MRVTVGMIAGQIGAGRVASRSRRHGIQKGET
jgi:hypothetical protein